jgi:hypothetical protein
MGLGDMMNDLSHGCLLKESNSFIKVIVGLVSKVALQVDSSEIIIQMVVIMLLWS